MSRSALVVAVALVSATVGLAACGGGSSSRTAAGASRTARSAASTPAAPSTAPATTSASRTAIATPPKPPPPPPLYPHLLTAALAGHGPGFTPVVTWRGQPAVWLSTPGSGVALLSFDQRRLELRLHSGTSDAGTLGWRYGPEIAGLERKRLVAAFNGGFRLNVGAGGFESFGRIGAPLRGGLGSIVTYTDGRTDIGSWHDEVPAPGKRVASVRQNLAPLIDHGNAASTLDCLTCWGATLHGVIAPARAALGITAKGRLVWAGGEHLTVRQLAAALLGAHVVRAVELDINPEWVAAYLYGHRGGHGPLAAVPVMPGQQGIPGEFLAPWSRDFFTIVAR